MVWGKPTVTHIKKRTLPACTVTENKNVAAFLSPFDHYFTCQKVKDVKRIKFLEASGHVVLAVRRGFITGTSERVEGTLLTRNETTHEK